MPEWYFLFIPPRIKFDMFIRVSQCLIVTGGEYNDGRHICSHKRRLQATIRQWITTNNIKLTYSLPFY